MVEMIHLVKYNGLFIVLWRNGRSIIDIETAFECDAAGIVQQFYRWKAVLRVTAEELAHQQNSDTLFNWL
jgi:hypothetical protein